MKIITNDAIIMFQQLNDFVKKDEALPAKFAWNIDDNLELLTNIVKKFENHRNELLKPLQDKGAFETNEEGKMAVKNEYVKEFTEVMLQINDYLQTETEVEFKKVEESDIPEMISPKDLNAIKFMIERG